MKTWMLKLITAVTFASLFLTLPARAQDNDGCSIRTLSGDYTFTIQGQIVHPDGSLDYRAGVAITHFDPVNGSLSQDDFVMSSAFKGPVPTPPSDHAPSGFHTNETGTYTVNPDCTGNASINFPGGIIITLMLVVDPSGDTVHTVVSSVTLPGGGSPGTPIIHSDGRRQHRRLEQAANPQGTQGNREANVSYNAKAPDGEKSPRTKA
ncbi:MAG TPA: hypothetical protein VEI54_11145 [Candidatus Limnocylindrales bacterium]|nr:hypothetical protein [Candidatus Limnocylindrales bacterium]